MAIILLIEDTELVRRAVTRMLASLGHKVVGAADGVEGVAIVSAIRPDLILCDFSMPRMDGHQFFQWLQEHRPGLLGNFMFFSSQDEEVFERLGLKHVPRLDKPSTKQEVEKQVSHMLGRAQA